MFPPITCDYLCSLNNNGKEEGKPVGLITTESNHLLPDLLVLSSMFLCSYDYPDLETLLQLFHFSIFTASFKMSPYIYYILKAYLLSTYHVQERGKRKITYIVLCLQVVQRLSVLMRGLCEESQLRRAEGAMQMRCQS